MSELDNQLLSLNINNDKNKYKGICINTKNFVYGQLLKENNNFFIISKDNIKTKIIPSSLAKKAFKNIYERDFIMLKENNHSRYIVELHEDEFMGKELTRIGYTSCTSYIGLKANYHKIKIIGNWYYDYYLYTSTNLFFKNPIQLKSNKTVHEVYYNDILIGYIYTYSKNILSNDEEVFWSINLTEEQCKTICKDYSESEDIGYYNINFKITKEKNYSYLERITQLIVDTNKNMTTDITFCAISKECPKKETCKRHLTIKVDYNLSWFLPVENKEYDKCEYYYKK